MKKAEGCLLTLAGLAVGWVTAVEAAPFIVEEGRPRAEIVIAEKPPRMVTLAARELQEYVRKISGAELPIVTEPGDEQPVKIYIGKSAHTDRLRVTDEGLKYGAFWMVSGPRWLVLLGHDFDFEPKEPWAHKRSDQPRAQEKWDELTGAAWLNPMRSLWRQYHRQTGIWFHDQGGSFNAVCEFLRMLGVRWYMPGDLGEVVPEMASIPLAALNKTVRPDSAMRRWFGAYFAYTLDTWMWDRRLGMNSGYEVLGAGMHVHGMRLVQGRKELQKAHPEYFAIYGGKRDTEFRGTGHACFSSEGLVQETARFARAVFDIYDEPAVSLWPQDGFRQCQCEKCWGMSPSDSVWGFVDRVAREVYKTHPDKKITCGAYGSYRTPPKSIEKFSPNVVVFIAAHRPGLDRLETWRTQWELIEGWLKKTGPGRLIRNSNNYYDLVVHPRSFARELRAVKGLSLGDWNEVRRGTVKPGTVAWRTPGIDHLNQYVNARFLWDADRDLDALLDEYYALFYGPARDEMKAAFEYAEANYSRVGRARFELKHRIRFVELLRTAREKAGDAIYGQRIQLIMDELPSSDELRQALKEETEARLRKDAPLAVGHDAGRPDGLQTYTLKDLATGEEVEIETTFQVTWDRNALVFDIRCEDPDMANLFVSRDVWGGDSVAILLQTPYHAYYQIEINPDGEVFDADRRHGRLQTRWSSRIEVKTHRGEDYWRVEARIPVVGEAEGVLDPYNFVVGDKPSAERPWYFNVGRVRIRNLEKTAYGFSPTGSTYHVPMKFGRLEIR